MHARVMRHSTTSRAAWMSPLVELVGKDNGITRVVSLVTEHGNHPQWNFPLFAVEEMKKIYKPTQMEI